MVRWCVWSRSDRFALPLRFGAVHAADSQELVIHVLAAQRYEPANLPGATIPTAVELRVAARERFGPVYAALFDVAQARQPGGLITEFAGAASSCAPGRLSDAELGALGLEVAPSLADAPADALVVTRLHARWSAGSVPEDLELRAAEAIVEAVAPGRVALPVVRDSVAPRAADNAFQARYLIRHAWAGALRCAAPVHGVWGAPPAGDAPVPRLVRGVSDVDRGLPLAEYLAQDLPELGIKARRCGCELAGSTANLGALLVLALARRRRRPRGAAEPRACGDVGVRAR